MGSTPVLISAYDRPYHLEKCVESLKLNHGSEDIILFIASDGPKDGKAVTKVNQVREYIKNISGFEKIYTYIAKDNTNREILFNTLETVRSFYPTYIFTEDDNIFSKHYYKYITMSLNLYKDDNQVLYVCGYTDEELYLNTYESFKARAFSSWGYATWSDKELLKYDLEIFSKSILRSRIKLFKSLMDLPNSINYIYDFCNGGLFAQDVLTRAYLHHNNKYSIFPNISMVRNIGHDGSGLHCDNRYQDKYQHQPISDYECAVTGKETVRHIKKNRILRDITLKDYVRACSIYASKLIFQ